MKKLTLGSFANGAGTRTPASTSERTIILIDSAGAKAVVLDSDPSTRKGQDDFVREIDLACGGEVTSPGDPIEAPTGCPRFITFNSVPVKTFAEVAKTPTLIVNVSDNNPENGKETTLHGTVAVFALDLNSNSVCGLTPEEQDAVFNSLTRHMARSKHGRREEINAAIINTREQNPFALLAAAVGSLAGLEAEINGQ